MESNRAGGREMQAQTPPSGPTLCRTGCGFYAHSAFDGMCSKCYKDNTVNSSASSTSTNSPALLTKGNILIFLLTFFMLLLSARGIITPSPIHRGTGYCFRSISLFVCMYYLSFFLCFFVSKITRKRLAGPICMKFSRKVWSDHGTT